jgi:hypothetical protein
LLFKTQTPWGGSENNRLFSFDLDTLEVAELLEARPDPTTGGKGVVYGSMRCAPGCTDWCLVTDSDRGVLQRLRVRSGGVGEPRTVRVETTVGLPPIGLTYR